MRKAGRGRLYSGVFVCIYAIFLTPGHCASKHLVTLDDLETIKSADNLQLSPDGNLLAYVEDNEVWLINTQPNNEPRTLGKGSLPKWSPGGERLAYYSSQSGSLQLWVYEIDSGQSEQITDFPNGIDPDPYTRLLGWTDDPLKYSWSPKGDALVFASRTPAHGSTAVVDADPASSLPGAPLILTTRTPPEWTLSGIFRSGGFGVPAFVNGKIDWSRKSISVSTPKSNQLFIVDLRSRAIRQLTQGGGAYFNPDWSPDGKTIVFASSEGRSLIGYGSGTTNIYAVDVMTMKIAALTKGPGDKRMPSWSADGKWIAYLENEHFKRQTVIVIPSNGGLPTDLTSALDRYVSEFTWDADAKHIIITYQDGIWWRLSRVSRETRRREELAPSDPSIRLHPTVSRSGDIVWEETNGCSDGLITFLRAGVGKPLVVTDLNPQIQSWRLGKQETVRWKNHRGDAMQGVLIKPVDYEEGRKYPLIVDVYPDQASGFKAFPMTGNQAWASRGYAVFWPNARAPHVWMNPFRSQKFDEAGKGLKGLIVMVDDIVTGITELIKEGVVDGDRIGVYGFSNGGAVVDQVITKTAIFKCAVSVSAADGVDWSRPFFLHSMDPLVPMTVGVLPWDDPGTYSGLSAANRLNAVKVPVLLADGDDDGDFLLNSIEMYNGLRYLGRDVIFLRYPNQGHGFTGASLRDFWQRENAFFDEHLKRGSIN